MLRGSTMSLKAKIEAVIYASEEPVTLAQLAGLLSVEAQGELDRLDARQQTLNLNPNAEAQAAGEDAVVEAVVAAVGAEAVGEETQLPGAETEAGAGEETGVAEEAAAVAEVAGAEEPGEAAASVAVPVAGVAGKRRAKDPVVEATRESKELAKNQERRLREYFREILDELIADYATSERGLEIREVAGGFRMATKPEYHDAVRGFVRGLKPALKLSLQALETLAVVAYKQPITAPEVSEIRGVDSGGVLGSLMGRKLITTAGRKQVIGRPILYKTTKDFLMRFGLKDVAELPSIEEFEKMAGELADVEPVQKEIPMEEHPAEASETAEELRTAAEVEQEKDATEPQADGDSTPVEEALPAEGSESDVPREDALADEAKVQSDEPVEEHHGEEE
jgi:segregation and condensation protein B